MNCIIFGCNNTAENNFGVRLRRADATAIWAPNTDAYICEQHAVQGLRVNVVFEPTSDGQVHTTVSSIKTPSANRITPIKNPV